MFVGEAPGYHEDRTGIPFVGQAGALLDRLLAGIGLTRDDVFVANVLKCRPPANRDPMPAEIRSCEPHLFRQVGLIGPAVICTLGNFATRLLSGRPDPISRVHGCELPVEIGGRRTLLYPMLHPAAALYTPAMSATLAEDFARIPQLLARVRAERGGGEPAPRGHATAAVPAMPPAPVADARAAPGSHVPAAVPVTAPHPRGGTGAAPPAPAPAVAAAVSPAPPGGGPAVPSPPAAEPDDAPSPAGAVQLGLF
jgi:DNA polymerase